jgi:hypothetical protein
MQFPHALWLDNNICGCNRLRDWEIRAVDFPPLAASAGRRFGRVLERAIHVRCVAGEFAVASGDVRVLCDGAVLNVRVGRRERGEDGFGETE